MAYYTNLITRCVDEGDCSEETLRYLANLMSYIDFRDRVSATMSNENILKMGNYFCWDEGKVLWKIETIDKLPHQHFPDLHYYVDWEGERYDFDNPEEVPRMCPWPFFGSIFGYEFVFKSKWPSWDMRKEFNMLSFSFADMEVVDEMDTFGLLQSRISDELGARFSLNFIEGKVSIDLEFVPEKVAEVVFFVDTGADFSITSRSYFEKKFPQTSEFLFNAAYGQNLPPIPVKLDVIGTKFRSGRQFEENSSVRMVSKLFVVRDEFIQPYQTFLKHSIVLHVLGENAMDGYTRIFIPSNSGIEEVGGMKVENRKQVLFIPTTGNDKDLVSKIIFKYKDK